MSLNEYLDAQRDHASRAKVSAIRSQLAAGTYDVDGKFPVAADRLVTDVLTGRELRAAACRAVDEKRQELRRAEWDRLNVADRFE